MNQADKRRSRRCDMSDFALLEYEHTNAPIQCVVVDVSNGGLQIWSKVELLSGTRCRLDIPRADGGTIHVHGEVKHCTHIAGSDTFASGFRFIPMSAVEQAAIHAYVQDAFKRQASGQARKAGLNNLPPKRSKSA